MATTTQASTLTLTCEQLEQALSDSEMQEILHAAGYEEQTDITLTEDDIDEAFEDVDLGDVTLSDDDKKTVRDRLNRMLNANKQDPIEAGLRKAIIDRLFMWQQVHRSIAS